MLSFGVESLVFQSAIKNLKFNVYRIIILPVVFYGCETWSLTLREEGRLRVFENRVLRRIFGPKRDEVYKFLFQFHADNCGKEQFGILP